MKPNSICDNDARTMLRSLAPSLAQCHGASTPWGSNEASPAATLENQSQRWLIWQEFKQESSSSYKE